MLQKIAQFSYDTAFDLSMGYYHISLDKEAQELCTTCLPWGITRKRGYPWDCSIRAPDIFRAVRNELIGDLPYALVYLDDVLIMNTKDEMTITYGR
jgi:hypothetical protein